MTGAPLPEIKVLEGSLTDGDETVLVNASNTQVDLGSGVSAAIARACGPSFQAHIHAARDKVYRGPMSPGDVLFTHAGDHPRAKYVAHAAVMDYRGAGGVAHPDAVRIERCLVNLWKGLESVPGEDRLSVALPALGAGTGRLGVRLPTELACKTLEMHLASISSTRIGRVTFYGYMLHEWIAILDVVRTHFDLPESAIPAELRGLLSDP
jgi:O-acetyl-ADP-ribose deacetylase (regulator of RNase III)